MPLANGLEGVEGEFVIDDREEFAGGDVTEQEPVEQDAAADPVATDAPLPDISTLPPELQAIAKSFQADWTRKSQELASLKEKAAEAEKLNAIFNDPEQLKLFMKVMQERVGSTEQGQQSQQQAPAWRSVKPQEVLHDDVFMAVQATSAQMVQELLGPTLQKLATYEKWLEGDVRPALTEFRQGRVTSEWDSIASGYANANEFKTQALELAQKTGLTLKQALHAAGGEALRKASAAQDSAQQNTQTDKRRSVLTKGGSPAANGKRAMSRDGADIVMEVARSMGLKNFPY